MFYNNLYKQLAAVRAERLVIWKGTSTGGCCGSSRHSSGNHKGHFEELLALMLRHN